MKQICRKIVCFLSALILILSVSATVFAHSGRTDSSGGHKDNKNKSGLGSYHYHCGGYPPHLHTNGYCPYTDILPSRVSVSVESNTLRLGKSASITASVYPENACNTQVNWKSSDPGVVKISGGVLTAVGFGTATITASTFNEVLSSVVVTVQEYPVESVEIAERESINQSLNMGESLLLRANVQPEDADRNTVIWTSSDDSVATVSNGTVTAHKEGKVTITASTENGKYDSMEIGIKEVIAERINLEFPEKMYIGETADITATVDPENTSYPEVIWKSSDPSILTVDENGHIFAAAVGSAAIHAVQKTLTQSAEIEILPVDVEKVEIRYDPLEEALGIQETLQFYAKVSPDNATYQQIIWSVSDTRIGVIDETGLLTATGSGTVTVYARTMDGVEASTTLSVVNKQIPVMIGAGGVCSIAAAGGTAVLLRKKKKRGSRKKGRFER